MLAQNVLLWRIRNTCGNMSSCLSTQHYNYFGAAAFTFLQEQPYRHLRAICRIPQSATDNVDAVSSSPRRQLIKGGKSTCKLCRHREQYLLLQQHGSRQASSMRSFFSFISTSVAAQLVTTTAGQCQAPCSFSLYQRWSPQFGCGSVIRA